MATTDYDKQAAVVILNKILEAELAGVVRYTHYSFMVYGFGRIPIVKWLREQADERRASAASEHPPLAGIAFESEIPQKLVDLVRKAQEEHTDG